MWDANVISTVQKYKLCTNTAYEGRRDGWKPKKKHRLLEIILSQMKPLEVLCCNRKIMLNFKALCFHRETFTSFIYRPDQGNFPPWVVLPSSTCCWPVVQMGIKELNYRQESDQRLLLTSLWVHLRALLNKRSLSVQIWNFGEIYGLTQWQEGKQE